MDFSNGAKDAQDMLVSLTEEINISNWAAIHQKYIFVFTEKGYKLGIGWSMILN